MIDKLPDGYDQMIGKRFRNGVDLSGGEWQKIAIARAYMRDADVLILDEPTAALDARAEFEVFQRFKELSQGKTAVLISHRFSSVRMADRILVLADGQVEAAGTHDELMAQAGATRSCSSCRRRGIADARPPGAPAEAPVPRRTHAGVTADARRVVSPPSPPESPAPTARPRSRRSPRPPPPRPGCRRRPACRPSRRATC